MHVICWLRQVLNFRIGILSEKIRVKRLISLAPNRITAINFKLLDIPARIEIVIFYEIPPWLFLCTRVF